MTRHARVQGDITLPSPSVPCLLVGVHTEERLPRPFIPCESLSQTNITPKQCCCCVGLLPHRIVYTIRHNVHVYVVKLARLRFLLLLLSTECLN